MVLPLKAAAELEAQKLERKKASLREAENELESRKNALEKITGEYDTAMRTMAELEQGLERTKNNISSARSLVKGLEGEKYRWGREHAILEAQLARIPCECTLAAGFLVYAGPLSQAQRKAMLKQWPWIVRWGQLPEITACMDSSYLFQAETQKLKESLEERPEDELSAEGDDFDEGKDVKEGIMKIIQSLLVPSNLEERWVLQGLPADEHSLQNAIIVMNTIPEKRVPILIDSQSQGSSWLERTLLDSDPSRLVLTQHDEGLSKSIEDAMLLGKSVVVNEVTPGTLPLVLQSLITRKQATIPSSISLDGDANSSVSPASLPSIEHEVSEGVKESARDSW